MTANTTPEGANANAIAGLTKEMLLAALVKGYEDAKPINDSLVDVSLRVQAISAEIYRRSIIKHLPGTVVGRRRTVMKLNVSVHPNTGLPKFVQRLAQLQQENVEIIAVEYDENTGDYSFFTHPEFDLSTGEPKL
jgi:hypothetical protein